MKDSFYWISCIGSSIYLFGNIALSVASYYMKCWQQYCHIFVISYDQRKYCERIAKERKTYLVSILFNWFVRFSKYGSYTIQ